MQTLQELNETFAIKDHLKFEQDAYGLIHATVTTAHATATVYTYGAHLTAWQPAAEKPAIYLSPKTALEQGKPIRGGVPVLFPWFGPRTFGLEKDKAYPMHGFARVSDWKVESTHYGADGDVVITMSLAPNELSKTVGYDSFHAAIAFHIGTELKMTLEVTNHGAHPIEFEEGFHSYWAVGDPHTATVEGLDGVDYLDKRDDFKRKTQEGTLHFTRDVDSVYLNTTSPVVIKDPTWKREIHIEKEGSSTTVCWNPWSVLTPGIADLAVDSWEHFVCVEVVNAAENRITLKPGATHSMTSKASIHDSLHAGE